MPLLNPNPNPNPNPHPNPNPNPSPNPSPSPRPDPKQLRRARHELQTRLGRSATDEELAAHLGMSMKKVLLADR